MAWTVKYKGLTGYQKSFTGVDETAKTVAQLITDIKNDETGSGTGTSIDGPDSLTYDDLYYEFYVERDNSIELTALTGTDKINAHLQDGDLVICTIDLSGNPRVKQQIKLGAAQLKRNAPMYGTPSDAPFYRTNNEFEWDNVPAVYNTDGTVTDNDSGLVAQRPWNTALGVAGVDVSALTLAAGLIERTYNSDYFGDKSAPFDDQTAYDAFFGGSPTIDNESAVTSIDRNGTVASTTTYTLLGYFKPDTTGTWNFRIRSDDGSYLFLGTNAEVNDNDAPTSTTLSNAVVDNGGTHAAASADGDFYLEAGSYYYMYAIFGNNTGPGTAQFFFTKPGGSEDNDFTGLLFYNTATNGH